MNFTSSEAATYFDALRPMVAPLASCELFVLPPFTSMCVGEPRPGSLDAALDHVLRQARAGMSMVPEHDRARVVIAYEPVWAIGEGAAAADPAHVGAVHLGLHELGARVIYGGSVDPFTAGPILREDGVDGLFVGRAALDPKRFATIAQLAGS